MYIQCKQTELTVLPTSTHENGNVERSEQSHSADVIVKILQEFHIVNANGSGRAKGEELDHKCCKYDD